MTDPKDADVPGDAELRARLVRHFRTVYHAQHGYFAQGVHYPPHANGGRRCDRCIETHRRF